MASGCHVCDYRNDIASSPPLSPFQLGVCIVTLNFRISIAQKQTASYIALNTLLNDIIDDEESIANSSTFTAWSPCLNDPKTAVIVTSVRGVCDAASSPVFDGIVQYLANPPKVQHVHLGLAALSLAVSSVDQRIACDITQLHASSPETATAIGKQFGWDPKRSSLSSKLQSCTTATFGQPGDLTRDFFAWAEASHEKPRTHSTSTGSSSLSLPSLIGVNSDEREDHASFCSLEERQQLGGLGEESLIMIFQWTSHADADRFKDQSQKSYGPNGAEVRKDLWDKEIAHPIGHLNRIGAKVDSYRLELRAVEPRICYILKAGSVAFTERESRSRRLTVYASELGGKVSRLWRQRALSA